MCYTKLINTKNISPDDWLKFRKKGIGGSDAGAILGFNKYKSPFNVFIDKTTDYKDDLSDNEAVYWGTVLEDVIAKEFTKRTGLKVRKVNAILQSQAHLFMLANLDRVIEGENAILECKTTNQFKSSEWIDDEVPESYICQCQHYMAVTGAEKCYIACLIGGQKFTYKTILRDDEFINYLIEREREFWENHVLKNEPPAIDGSDGATEYLKNKYPKSNGTSVMFTSDYSTYLDDLASKKQLKKEVEDQIADLENKIKLFLGDAESGQSEKYIVTWKNTAGRKNLDVDALKEDYSIEDLDDYFTSTTVRKFLLKEI